MANFRYILGSQSFYTVLHNSPYERCKWPLLLQRIIRCCCSVWDAVSKVLCNDAPEGYIGDELEDESGIDTKNLLSYCFRATAESRYVIIWLMSCQNLTSTLALY